MYIFNLSDADQQAIRRDVIDALHQHGKYTDQLLEDAMNSKIEDLEDLIDISPYIY